MFAHSKVLLADPDEELLALYSNQLVEAGFEVETATDGVTCVERLKSFDPDLLVLEPMIPWGQGEGIMTLMREEADVPLVPVILVTGGTDLLEDYQLPRFPVLERHQKPLSPADLLASVMHLIKATAER
jgi:DNA-binding response OmpR family regulator